MDNCVFCKIRNGEISSEIVYKDDDFMIIKDINPQAKIHLIAIPKNHAARLHLIDENSATQIGKIIYKISKMQKMLGIEGGYRLIINQGENGGQTVDHIHIHILGGEKLN